MPGLASLIEALGGFRYIHYTTHTISHLSSTEFNFTFFTVKGGTSSYEVGRSIIEAIRRVQSDKLDIPLEAFSRRSEFGKEQTAPSRFEMWQCISVRS